MNKGALASVVGSVALFASSIGIASATALPLCTISVPPGTHYIGQSVRLLWVTQDATSASITTLGAVPPAHIAQGYRDITPTGNTLITMTVGNGMGTRTCSVLIMMTPIPKPQPIYQTVPTTQTQYMPVYTTTTARPQTQNIWTPFYTTPTSQYRSFYDTSYASNSYYYAGETTHTYSSFYDSSSYRDNGYYYLSDSPGDCYFSGQCNGSWNEPYQLNTISSDNSQDYFLTSGGNTYGAFYDCPQGSANCGLVGTSQLENANDFNNAAGTVQNGSWDTTYTNPTQQPDYAAPVDTGGWWNGSPPPANDTGWDNEVYYTPAPTTYENPQYDI